MPKAVRNLKAGNFSLVQDHSTGELIAQYKDETQKLKDALASSQARVAALEAKQVSMGLLTSFLSPLVFCCFWRGGMLNKRGRLTRRSLSRNAHLLFYSFTLFFCFIYLWHEVKADSFFFLTSSRLFLPSSQVLCYFLLNAPISGRNVYEGSFFKNIK